MANILHQLEAAEDDANLTFLRSEVARLRMTDAEREAVEWFSRFATPQNGPVIGRHAAALRGLLERLSRPDKSYPKRCVL